jgi:TRAP-type C4-dicarboxylate transport system permease small subunit
MGQAAPIAPSKMRVMRLLIIWISWFSYRLATLSGMVTALITVIIFIDIVSRSLLNHSVQGASEVAILLLVVMIFLGFAGAEAKGENFSMTILTNSLGPGARRATSIVSKLVSIATISLLAWFSWEEAIHSTISQEQSYGVIAFPIWPNRVVVAFGLTTLALQLLAGLIGTVLTAKRSTDD